MVLAARPKPYPQVKADKKARQHDFNMKALDMLGSVAIPIITHPITLMMGASIANQYVYNKGWLCPHDPYHNDREDWDAALNASDWIFFCTLAAGIAAAAKDMAPVAGKVGSLIKGL